MGFLKQNSNLIIMQQGSLKSFKTKVLKTDGENFEVAKGDINFEKNENAEFILKNDNNIIKFNSSFLDEKGDKFIFKIPKEHLLIQRREYKRVSLKLPVDLRNDSQSIKAQTVDISGGGMKIALNTIKSKNDLLNTKLYVLNKRTIDSIFEVLRVEEDKMEKNKFFLSGSFKKIKGEDRTTLIHLCFKQHLEMKCKNKATKRSR